jgi:hypothetical protein
MAVVAYIHPCCGLAGIHPHGNSSAFFMESASSGSLLNSRMRTGRIQVLLHHSLPYLYIIDALLIMGAGMAIFMY